MDSLLASVLHHVHSSNMLTVTMQRYHQWTAESYRCSHTLPRSIGISQKDNRDGDVTYSTFAVSSLQVQISSRTSRRGSDGLACAVHFSCCRIPMCKDIGGNCMGHKVCTRMDFLPVLTWHHCAALAWNSPDWSAIGEPDALIFSKLPWRGQRTLKPAWRQCSHSRNMSELPQLCPQ